MTLDLDERLRQYYSYLADEVDGRPERLDEVLALSAAPTSERSVASTGRRWSALLVAAVAIIVVAGVAAIATRGDDDAPTFVDAVLMTRMLSAVETLEDDEWVLLGDVPDGLAYMYASWDDPTSTTTDRTVRYGNERVSGTFERLSVTVSAGAAASGETIVVGGRTWSVDDPIAGGWTAVRRLGDQAIVVRDSGAFGVDARRLLAELLVVTSSKLPEAPLGDDLVLVARSSSGAHLSAQQSGDYWSTALDGSPSCCAPIDTDVQGITLEQVNSVVADGSPMSTTVLSGTVSAAAATVGVEFDDGTVAEAVATDLSGRFDRRFWVVDVVAPVSAVPIEVTSYDEAGRRLATIIPEP